MPSGGSADEKPCVSAECGQARGVASHAASQGCTARGRASAPPVSYAALEENLSCAQWDSPRYAGAQLRSQRARSSGTADGGSGLLCLKEKSTARLAAVRRWSVEILKKKVASERSDELGLAQRKKAQMLEWSKCSNGLKKTAAATQDDFLQGLPMRASRLLEKPTAWADDLCLVAARWLSGLPPSGLASSTSICSVRRKSDASRNALLQTWTWRKS